MIRLRVECSKAISTTLRVLAFFPDGILRKVYGMHSTAASHHVLVMDFNEHEPGLADAIAAARQDPGILRIVEEVT